MYLPRFSPKHGRYRRSEQGTDAVSGFMLEGVQNQIEEGKYALMES